MKQEEQAQKIVSLIKETCNSTDEQSANMAVIFIDMLIAHTKKLKYLNEEPQIRYWRGVQSCVES